MKVLVFVEGNDFICSFQFTINARGSGWYLKNSTHYFVGVQRKSVIKKRFSLSIFNSTQKIILSIIITTS